MIGYRVLLRQLGEGGGAGIHQCCGAHHRFGQFPVGTEQGELFLPQVQIAFCDCVHAVVFGHPPLRPAI